MVSEAEKKRMKRIYESNEDINYHRENNIMLINKFGTKAEKVKAQKLDAVVEKRGYSEKEESDWFYIHGTKKYYKKLN